MGAENAPTRPNEWRYDEETDYQCQTDPIGDLH